MGLYSPYVFMAFDSHVCIHPGPYDGMGGVFWPHESDSSPICLWFYIDTFINTKGVWPGVVLGIMLGSTLFMRDTLAGRLAHLDHLGHQIFVSTQL